MAKDEPVYTGAEQSAMPKNEFDDEQRDDPLFMGLVIVIAESHDCTYKRGGNIRFAIDESCQTRDIERAGEIGYLLFTRSILWISNGERTEKKKNNASQFARRSRCFGLADGTLVFTLE